MRVGIIGAGISGLALGAALHRGGVDVQLYERHGHIRGTGAGITLAENGLTALDALGIGVAFRHRQWGQTLVRGGIRCPEGEWLSCIPADGLGIDRAELHTLLLKHLPETLVHTSAEAVDVEAQTGTVTFADGKVERFDVVVGADGIRSAVRRSCFHDPGIAYAGCNAWRGVSDGPLYDAVFETWGERARFGAVPLHDGRVYWFAVLSGAEATPGEARLDLLKSTFASWHDPIPDLLRATPDESIQLLPIQELVSPLPTYCNGKVVLVGDAAHAMTPNLGQGACQGLEDVAVLSALLLNGTQDIRTYDEYRLRRSQTIARQSRLVGRAIHAGGRKVASIRNWVLGRVPDSVSQRQVQSVTAWQMPAL